MSDDKDTNDTRARTQPGFHAEEAAVASINPESPVRLRECLTALARSTGHHVLRVEVGLGLSSVTKDEPALTMIVTHSLGEDFEKEIGPSIARMFTYTLNGLLKKHRKPMGAEGTAIVALADAVERLVLSDIFCWELHDAG